MVDEKLKLEVYSRDNWHCRYCSKPVFYGKALILFEKLNPGHLYHHGHGKTGEMLEIFQKQLASLDHMVPQNAQGEDTLDNLVTSCWGCNNHFKDKKHSEGKPMPKEIIQSTWDGFYGLYLHLK